MANHISYSKATSDTDAFDKVKSGVRADLMDNFGVKAEIHYDEAGKKIIAKGRGFELKVSFGPNSLGLELSLGLFLKPFHGKVMSVLESEFKKVV